MLNVKLIELHLAFQTKDAAVGAVYVELSCFTLLSYTCDEKLTCLNHFL